MALAASAAITCNVLCRAQLHGRFGSSAAISMVVLGLVFVTGMRRRSKVVRRVVWGGLFGLLVLAGAASVALGYAVYQSRHDLGNGQNTAEFGVVALENGDYVYGGRLVPAIRRDPGPGARPPHLGVDAPRRRRAHRGPASFGGGRHERRRRLRRAHGAHSAERDRPRRAPGARRQDRRGRVLQRLQQPLTDVQQALVRLQATTDASQSPWLVHRAVYVVDDFTESIDEHLPSLDRALDAIGAGAADAGRHGAARSTWCSSPPLRSRVVWGDAGELRRDPRRRRQVVARRRRPCRRPGRAGAAGRRGRPRQRGVPRPVRTLRIRRRRPGRQRCVPEPDDVARLPDDRARLPRICTSRPRDVTSMAWSSSTPPCS